MTRFYLLTLCYVTSSLWAHMLQHNLKSTSIACVQSSSKFDDRSSVNCNPISMSCNQSAFEMNGSLYRAEVYCALLYIIHYFKRVVGFKERIIDRRQSISNLTWNFVKKIFSRKIDSCYFPSKISISTSSKCKYAAFNDKAD